MYNVVANELSVWVDCDDTLVMHHIPLGNPNLTYVDLNYYGTPKTLAVHTAHLELVKAYKARGYQVIVHSNNGSAWAEEVVKALGLSRDVDEIRTKPTKIMDDQNIGNAFGTLVYIPFVAPAVTFSYL